MDSDNNNNVVNFELINIRGPKTPLRQLLALTATFKGHKPNVIDSEKLELEERQPHGALRIEGFWPSVEYLNDRYPYPALYLGNVVQDSIIRSIVTSIQHNTDEILATLRSGASIPGKSHAFLVGKNPTLLDLAAAAYADLSDPFWLNHFNQLALYIKERKVA